MVNTIKIVISIIILISIASISHAQSIGYGSPTARRAGIHRGNQVKTVFSNWGVIAQPYQEGPVGAWKYETNGYVGDVSPLIGLKLPLKDYDNDSEIDTIFSVVVPDVERPGGGDLSPGGGVSWTFEPIPGFANPNVNEIGKGVAMSHQPETWPSFWPDRPMWVDENGFPEWNGYFGRGQMNADQESYFVMDDNADEKMFSSYNFLPDSSNPIRKGQGIQVYVRGMQWSNILAQDVIFWLYEVKNVGTTIYDQAVFGVLVGTYVGIAGDEWNDDASFFNIRDNITYTWDFDQYVRPSANPYWQPSPYEVGYIAYAFLESPGNPYDGIDNDGDNRLYDNTANYFTETDFQQKILREGDRLILIEKGSYARSEFIMPGHPVTVTSLGKEFYLVPDSTVLKEGNIDKNGNLGKDAYDGYDNDFDGLIDENYQVHYRQYKVSTDGTVLIDTLNPIQFKNFITGVGTNDLMIDESRDDGIDNDRDWDPERDDLGADGKPYTGDSGENDGVPTPGEPNFDQTDVDESDQIGLTSFQYFTPAGAITMSDENEMWDRLKPGHFDVPSSIVNNVAIRGEDGDFIYGSGYFPLLPQKTGRFSLALAFGDNFPSVLKNVRVAQKIYNANYNFPKPPEKPTLSAVAGDGKVTLYWNKIAETSIDPYSKEIDFEGYKIYKGTDPDFSDSYTITDFNGTPKMYQPIAQFDLDNGITGIFQQSFELSEITGGVPFYLGNDSGIKNSFVDDDVVNGRTYYYAVVAYDKGNTEENIYPSENSKFIAKNTDGSIQLDKNTVSVTPISPVSGYLPPESGLSLERVSGYSNVVPYFEILDETKILNKTYEVTFIDSIIEKVQIAYAYNLIDTETGDTIFYKNENLSEDNGDVFNGTRISFDTKYQKINMIKINVDRSGWNKPDDMKLRYAVNVFNFPGYPPGYKEPADYEFVFSDLYNNSSTDKLLNTPVASRKTNFKIYDVTDPNNPISLPYGFISYDTLFNTGDRILLANADTSSFTWVIDLLGKTPLVPVFGDTLFLCINKPLSSKDKFSFTTNGPKNSNSDLQTQMDKIKVVPNPYIVTNIFESPLPLHLRGRGERVILFNHLPAGSKISIYTSSGNLVRHLSHDGNIHDGSVRWDLRNEDNLDVAFGVYFYIIEVEGFNYKKYGKIALIK